MASQSLPRFLYGGDYNPDQWPREVWDEDVRLFRLASINVATVAVFSWARLQPHEERFDFDWLDEIMDRLHTNGIAACLGTATAVPPAWLCQRYPGILPVTIDGQKRQFGQRMQFCPNSPDYRRATQRMARAMAERYAKHPALIMWHVANEYGPYCYCDTCAEAFRQWLRERYGSLDEVNRRWYTSFWGHTFYDWDQIVPPSHLSEEFTRGEWEGTAFQGISLDYRRFMSDSNLACYLGERQVLKEIAPHIPVTTNLMGHYKPLDYFKWAPYLDVIAWDSYPTNKDDASNIALRHDLMRSLKKQPFLLMEQTPSQQNWQAYNQLKRPGQMRLWSYQAIAHGSDAVMFFQLRRSRGACEKFHGALISHAGHENTRVFHECATLGEELERIGDDILGSASPARVGIIFDWENWWAVELSNGPSVALKYLPKIQKHYRAFFRRNVAVDFLPEEADFAGHDLIVAPVMYMVKPGVARRLEEFVRSGGTFVTTFFSGIVDDADLVTMGGYPGELRSLLGIWAEEIDALFPEQSNRLVLEEPFGAVRGEYQCGLLCDLIHLEGARALARYGEDFYAGRPAVTENSFGAGKAYYLASDPDEAFLEAFFAELCRVKGIDPVLETPKGVEAVQRVKGDRVFTFVLNHNPEPVEVDLGAEIQQDLLSGSEVSGRATIPGRGVLILRRE